MRDRGDGPGIIGLVADLTNPMWEHVVVDPRYRCLIPLSRFANPDGEPGSKTRTWFSVPDLDACAWAGFCRNVPGEGPVFAGMTTAASAAIPPTNDRMPVLVGADEHERWLHGTIQDVIGLQFREPIEPSRIVVDRTGEPWRGGNRRPASTQMPLI
jgi:putative SOS response-associated peptidase YedK